MTSAVPIPAATLVVMRPNAAGPPDLLMVERAAGMAFAPGALVFPGGRIDPADSILAADDEGAARVAAIRETIEEAGIAVGLIPAPDAATIATLRHSLAAGRAFATLLAEAGLAIAPAALVPFARWLPDLPGMRVFDTMFYLAEAPADARAVADGGESVHAFWASAAAILADADAGRHHLIFPTRRTLERLATFADFAAARDQARAIPIRPITPWIEQRADGRWLCLPDGLGYPVTAERMADVRRG